MVPEKVYVVLIKDPGATELGVLGTRGGPVRFIRAEPAEWYASMLTHKKRAYGEIYVVGEQKIAHDGPMGVKFYPEDNYELSSAWVARLRRDFEFDTRKEN